MTVFSGCWSFMNISTTNSFLSLSLFFRLAMIHLCKGVIVAVLTFEGSWFSWFRLSISFWIASWSLLTSKLVGLPEFLWASDSSWLWFCFPLSVDPPLDLPMISVLSSTRRFDWSSTYLAFLNLSASPPSTFEFWALAFAELRGVTTVLNLRAGLWAISSL